MAPFIRPFLAVAQTTLRAPDGDARLPFNGLFTTVDLPAGAFLGFYSGTFRDLPAAGYRGRNHYAFSASDQYVVPRATLRSPEGERTVDPARYPLAMCNEPARGRAANVAVKEHTRAGAGVLPHLPTRTPIVALGFYTCRAVRAGEELFVHYGKAYTRTHYPNPTGLPAEELHKLVGAPCAPPRERETPQQMWQAFFPGTQMRPDGECYALLE